MAAARRGKLLTIAFVVDTGLRMGRRVVGDASALHTVVEDIAGLLLPSRGKEDNAARFWARLREQWETVCVWVFDAGRAANFEPLADQPDGRPDGHARKGALALLRGCWIHASPPFVVLGQGHEHALRGVVEVLRGLSPSGCSSVHGALNAVAYALNAGRCGLLPPAARGVPVGTSFESKPGYTREWCDPSHLEAPARIVLATQHDTDLVEDE
eukprot:Hpha_TRINITY_DN20350_c0_g1::TRINITY_DN20350_c0_g1_i1::g.138102::m.138102